MTTLEVSGKEYSGEKLWREEEILRELYIKKPRSTREIGEMLGCSDVTIRNWLEHFGIERRSMVEALAVERRRSPAYFRTGQRGYEAWEHTYQGERYHVYVHRLLAVAEYGFEAVRDRPVHHKLGIRWTNWHDAIEVMDDSEHRSMHFKEVWENEEHQEMMHEVGKKTEAQMCRDENGDFTGKS